MRMLTLNYNVSHEALKRSIAKAPVSMSGMNILKVSVWNILVETYKYRSICPILRKRFNCYHTALTISLVSNNLYVLLKLKNCVLLLHLAVFSSFIQ